MTTPEVEQGAEPEVVVDTATPKDALSATRLAAVWALVGAAITAGAAVVVVDSTQADEISGWVLALGAVLVLVGLALGLLLARQRLLPVDQPASGADAGLAEGEMSRDAALALWVLGSAGVVSGGVTVFLSASGVGSAALIGGGILCLAMGAARRVPRRFWAE